MACKEFTLWQLILLIFICSLIFIVLIPPFSKARDRATLKSTIIDLQHWSQAISCYIIEYSQVPPSPAGQINYKKSLVKEILPYLRVLRIKDWWGYPLWIWTGKGIDQYGIKTVENKEFVLASLGKKGEIESWKYDPEHPQSGIFYVESALDYENDLVIWNGRFIRAPGTFSKIIMEP